MPRCMTTSHAHLCASVSTCAQVRALTVEVTRNEADWAAQLGPGGSWVENVDSCLKRHVPARGPRRWRGSSRHLGIPPSPNRACVLEWSATGWKNLTSKTTTFFEFKSYHVAPWRPSLWCSGQSHPGECGGPHATLQTTTGALNRAIARPLVDGTISSLVIDKATHIFWNSSENGDYDAHCQPRVVRGLHGRRPGGPARRHPQLRATTSRTSTRRASGCAVT